MGTYVCSRYIRHWIGKDQSWRHYLEFLTAAQSIIHKKTNPPITTKLTDWPFVMGIHRSPVDSPHKGQWRGALMLSMICAWTNGWANNRDAGDLRRIVLFMTSLLCRVHGHPSPCIPSGHCGTHPPHPPSACRRCSNHIFILELTPGSMDKVQTTAIRDGNHFTRGYHHDQAAPIRGLTVGFVARSWKCPLAQVLGHYHRQQLQTHSLKTWS